MTKQFIAKYNGRGIHDDGCVNSGDMKGFASNFKKELRINLAPLGIQIVDFSLGHYDISGFLEKNGHYIYFSYHVPRGMVPIDCSAQSAMRGILYRTAKSTKDYTGGHNHFTSFFDFETDVQRLFSFSERSVESA